MIDDLVKMLDSGMAMGVGHINVDTDITSKEAAKTSDNGMYGLLQNPFGMQCAYPASGS